MSKSSSKASRCGGWCGKCYENRRGRSNHRGHVGYRSPSPPPPWYVIMAMKRSQSTPAGSSTPSLVEDEFSKAYPNLHAWLSEVTWDDGSKRKPSTMLICVESGWMKCWFNDKDADRSAWFTAGSLSDLLVAVELGLENEDVPWRPNKRR